LAALRDLQLHAPVGRGDGDGRAEHRLADRHRDLDGEILAVALDVRMRPDLDDEVEVARPAPAARRAAFALHANACPVAHAGRDLDRETLALLGLPGSGASRACAATLPPGPAAVRTGHGATHGHRGPRAADRVPEVDLERVLDALPARCRGAGTGAPEAAEHLVQDVGEATLLLGPPPAPRRRGAEALEVEVPPRTPAEREAMTALGPVPVLARARRVETRLEPLEPELVVEPALVGVGEDVVRERDLLEPLLGLLVPRVQVRVILAGELAVRLLDVLGLGVFRDTEDGVEILRVRHPRATTCRVNRC